MKKIRGFSIIELLVVIAVIAIVSVIVTPNFIRWRNNAKMRDAVNNLMGDLEMAKINAVKENNFVAVCLIREGRFKWEKKHNRGAEKRPDVFFIFAGSLPGCTNEDRTPKSYCNTPRWPP